MVDASDAKEMIARLLGRAKHPEPSDMTLLYAWIYASYVLLEPFPVMRERFRKRCLESDDPPYERFKAGVSLLRSALRDSEKLFCAPARYSETYVRIREQIALEPRRDSSVTT